MNEADRAALIASAARIGANPLDLATVISYETGGTFSPSIRGGAGNRHIGLIQFGAPEQQRYGASQGQSFVEQLPAVEAYLTDRGFKPGMGRLDLYSTINAGSPGHYNASDAGNGGAPGTVADKVGKQMGAHEAKASAFLGGEFVPTMPAAAGGPAAPARFGFSGIEAAPTAAPSPAKPDDGPDVAAMLKTLMADGGGAVQAATAPAPAPTPAPAAPPRAAAPAFDTAAYLASLRRR